MNGLGQKHGQRSGAPEGVGVTAHDEENDGEDED